MKESFGLPTEVSKNEKLPLNIFSRINNLREYIKTLPDYIRKTGAFTVVFLMGVFNTVEAQNTDSNFDKAIDEIRLGKITIENAADSIYESYKKANSDSTFSYVEYNNHVKNKEEGLDTRFSGPEISGGQVGDTVSMGNYEAIEFSVIITNDNIISKSKKFDQEGRFLSAVKPYGGEIQSNSNEGISYTAFGNTKQEAIVSAIAGLAGFKNTEIFVTSLLEDKESTLNGEEKFTSNYVKIIRSKTNKTILENVKIVVNKTVDGFFVEAFCN